jgi:hypothetical protein
VAAITSEAGGTNNLILFSFGLRKITSHRNRTLFFPKANNFDSNIRGNAAVLIFVEDDITRLFQAEIPGGRGSAKSNKEWTETQPHSMVCAATYIYGAVQHFVPPLDGL